MPHSNPVHYHLKNKNHPAIIFRCRMVFLQCKWGSHLLINPTVIRCKYVHAHNPLFEFTPR